MAGKTEEARVTAEQEKFRADRAEVKSEKAENVRAPTSVGEAGSKPGSGKQAPKKDQRG